MAKDFKSFQELTVYLWESKKAIQTWVRLASKVISDTLVTQIKDRYGKQQPGRPSSDNPTPLVDTWKLRDSVRAVVVNDGSKAKVIIWTDAWTIAMVHEYWTVINNVSPAQWKAMRLSLEARWMYRKEKKKSWPKKWSITIPPRPIRRVALQENAKFIEDTLSYYMQVFK